jgi:hypothetical protein
MRHETFDNIYELLTERLNQIGPIRTRDAWKTCCDAQKDLDYSDRHGYSTLTVAFRQIMETMVEQGKAEKIKNGEYNILRPNQRYKTPIEA